MRDKKTKAVPVGRLGSVIVHISHLWFRTWSLHLPQNLPFFFAFFVFLSSTQPLFIPFSFGPLFSAVVILLLYGRWLVCPCLCLFYTLFLHLRRHHTMPFYFLFEGLVVTDRFRPLGLFRLLDDDAVHRKRHYIS